MAGFVSNTSPEPTLTPETIAGKQAFAVVRAAPIGEVLFFVGATPADMPPSEADAQAALAALP